MKLFVFVGVVFVCLFGCGAFAAGVYDGGTGTSVDPYQIRTAGQLIELSEHSEDWGLCFVLTDDIDMDPNVDGRTFTTAVIAPDISEDEFFQGEVFTGIFDGKGHVIRNLTINSNDEGNDYLGLFGLIEGVNACLKNLGLHNVNITVNDNSRNVGSLCGRNSYGATITNSYATGKISCLGNSDSFGGLCAENKSTGTVINSYADIEIIGGKDSDGLGGLCGDNAGLIINSYATGSIIGGDDLGGLCGINIDGSVINCFSNCSVTSITDSDSTGGLCGYIIHQVALISNSFFLDSITGGGPDNGVGIPLTSAQMNQQSSFTNWDFIYETSNGTSEVWQIDTGVDHPVLSSLNGYAPPVLSGDGSENNPYLINDAIELGALYHYNSDSHFKMLADIDLTDMQWSMAVVPVCRGSFNGNGYAISNLNIKGSCYLGLFGRIKGIDAEVRNLGLENVNVIASGTSFNLGGLCGSNGDFQIKGGTVRNCYVVGEISSDGYNSTNVGGMCGWNSYGSLINCYSSGSVSAKLYSSDYMGGLCGVNYEGIINNCYSSSSVINTSEYYSNIGGLCGTNYKGTISNCYAVGTVYGAGGLIGGNEGGIFLNCFWDSTVNAGLSDCGYDYVSETYNIDLASVDGVSTIDMQTLNTFRDVGWDFVGESFNGDADVWRLCVDGSSYPRLAWEFSSYGDFVCGDGVDLDDFDYFSQRYLSDGCGGMFGSAGGVVDGVMLGLIAEAWLSVECGDCFGGDVSGDGKVDVVDFDRISSQWECSAAVNWDRADLDGDGFIGDFDFDIFAYYWMGE